MDFFLSIRQKLLTFYCYRDGLERIHELETTNLEPEFAFSITNDSNRPDRECEPKSILNLPVFEIKTIKGVCKEVQLEGLQRISEE